MARVTAYRCWRARWVCSGERRSVVRSGTATRDLGMTSRHGRRHVDTAADAPAVGHGDPRRGDVAVDRPTLPDLDLVAGRNAAPDLAAHDGHAGPDIGEDRGLRPNRQNVTLDGKVSLDP